MTKSLRLILVYCIALLLTLSVAVSSFAAAAPVWKATQTATTSSAANSISVSMPRGVTEGDFMLAQITFQKGSDITVIAPEGWILVKMDNRSSDIGSAIYRKFGGNGETGPYQWRFSQKVSANGGIIAYTGVNTTNPIIASSGAGGDSGNPTAPGVTAEDNTKLVAFFSIKKNTTTSTPTGMTERYILRPKRDEPNSKAADQDVMAGTTGTRTSTVGSSDKWVAQIVALRAAVVSNTAPVAVDDSYNATVNTALSIPSLGVLANDTDAEANTLTAIKVANPSNGTVTLNPNGSFIYTPNAGYVGTATFTYKANDGSTDSNVATVSITINTQPVGAAVATQVRVETAADGSGTVVAARNLIIGTSLTGYAITRDQYGNYVGNLTTAIWYLINKTGSVTDSDLSPATGASAVMIGHKAGTGVIHVAATGLTSVDSGTVTVVAGSAGGGGMAVGGGGGGSGGTTTNNNVTLNGLSANANFKVNSSGLVQNAVQLKTADGRVTFDIPSGTKLMANKFDPIYILKANTMASVPPAPADSEIILAYNFAPDGVTFNPALLMTIIYDPVNLPKNNAEKDLYIANWDGTQWQPRGDTLDIGVKTVSARISHFSTYALVGKIVTPQTPLLTSTPTLTPAPVVTPTPTPVQPATLTPTQTVQSAPVTTLNQIVTPTLTPTSTLPPGGSPKLPSSLPLIVGIIGVLVSITILFTRIRHQRS
jgi:hypothetical protein